MSELDGTSQPPSLRLELSCDFAEVRGAAHTVHGYLAKQGCSDGELMDCEFALVEACNNAIKYADEAGRKQSVLVEARCDAEAIELQVSDHTPGFDWPEKVSLPDAESEHGRGVYLIQTLMDSAQYSRGPGGNVLRLRKKRNGA